MLKKFQSICFGLSLFNLWNILSFFWFSKLWDKQILWNGVGSCIIYIFQSDILDKNELHHVLYKRIEIMVY